MYNRTNRRASKKTAQRASILSLIALTLVSFFAVKWFGAGLTPKVAVADTQTAEAVIMPTKKQDEVVVVPLKAEPVKQEVANPVIPVEEPAPVEEAPVEEVIEAPLTEEPVAETSVGYPIVLANGNTAGPIGTEAAARMAAATGVPQETWEYIIARESNGDPNVANPSGAAGLFQTMPGWGSTATVEDQINTAIHVYNTQGLSAWSVD